jgi:hypothetical protein
MFVGAGLTTPMRLPSVLQSASCASWGVPEPRVDAWPAQSGPTLRQPLENPEPTLSQGAARRVWY